MPAYIHSIATAVPETFAKQEKVRDLMKSRFEGDRRTQAILHRVYSQSGIEKRHTVLHDFHSGSDDSFFNRAFSEHSCPSTSERNEKYTQEAIPLFLNVGEQLLNQNPELDKNSITHVITISCTGFFAPGPDFEIVRGLKLNPSTQRYHIGFMGCYAAFQGMKMAKAFCEADPDAVVMVIATELCSLHFQKKNDPDTLIASSVFADGAAGMIVSAKQPTHGFEMKAFTSSLAYEGEKDMAWTIGDSGFNMTLSSYVPDIISANLEDVITPLFESLKTTKEEIDLWAVHPGGRAIVDKVEETLGLQDDQVRSSRKVLAEFGNMSSVTVLFVLNDILLQKPDSGKTILPIAFGPGLTIETGLFTSVKS